MNNIQLDNYAEDLCFRIIAHGKTDSIDSIFISTDGFLDEDIEFHSAFRNFFLTNNEKSTLTFSDRLAEFRKDFLQPILKMKNGRIWPHDDATFISVHRIEK